MKSDEEWKKVLTPDEFKVLRKKDTERAFTGRYHDCHDDGIYVCAGCGAELFSSESKFDSETGWPSYWKPASENCVKFKDDFGIFRRKRRAVMCAACDGHLGHVFDDGPRPTGKRYCINSVALKLVKSGG